MSKKINKEFIENLRLNSTKLVVEFDDKISHEQIRDITYEVLKNKKELENE